MRTQSFSLFSFVLALNFEDHSLLAADALSAARSLQTPRKSATLLAARSWQPLYPEDDDGREKEKEAERPTKTEFADVGPDILPEKPKIVVLGATGKIGRLVVRQLLESDSLGDATIVALVRDYDKACRVLYDDILVTSSPRNRGKPQLQIVQGDLVPPDELPGPREENDAEDEAWMERASSAASFYRTKVSDYDDGQVRWEDSGYESLEEAISGCTSIISCVGAVRPTNLWTDFLARPFLRILKRDVSSWCRDPRHPYYVNFLSTRKALSFAEKEQMRREAVLDAMEEEGETESLKRRTNKHIPPRIRFIRISDLCVAQQPWQFVPLMTNIIHSMVFRYQDMTERLLQSSSLVDTVTLRPGDLCDDERNVTTTSLQIDPTGSLPAPSRVGREDVASLAVASALFTDNESATTSSLPQGKQPEQSREPSFHYTMAVRWAGDELDPYPAQGRKGDGLRDANACVQSALNTLREADERKKARRKTSRLPQRLSQRSIKPHALCAALPAYLLLFLFSRTIAQALFPYIPGKSLVLPVVSRIGDLFATIGAFAGSLLMRLVHSVPSLFSFRFRRAPEKYISF